MKQFNLKIDNITFELKQNFNFQWLNKYGTVFCVFDQQDSGNICFGVTKNKNKLFIKFAGAPTINYNGSAKDAIERMKKSISIYEEIKHPNLISLIEHFEHANGYVSIFEWVNGECLHAHWNFNKYPKYTHPLSPNYKFNQLSLTNKLNCLNTIFNVHKLIAQKGYIAIDFYDGSIIYDFETNQTTICDIDFYIKGAFINPVGRLWGSERFMAPEEFEKGMLIDEVTNVFTMGAIAFEILGNNYNRTLLEWQAPEKLFSVACKAINSNKSLRYKSIHEFYTAWEIATQLTE